jgi:probable HAF family extracellular repeat protein
MRRSNDTGPVLTSRSSIPLAGRLRANSPVAHNAYIADLSGNLYTVDASSVLMRSSWPTFQCGNRHGDAVGYHDDGTIIGYGRKGSSTNVVRWTKSGGVYQEEDLGSPPAGNQAFAYAYSNAKRIAGKAVFTQGGQWLAYVTGADAQSISTNANLGTLGGSQSEAWDVHDDSGTVGWAHNSNGRRRAFLVPIGVTSVSGCELPRLEGTSSTSYNSEAYGINQYGQVVGTVQNDSGAYRAFVFTSGVDTQLRNLSNLILSTGQTPASMGWVLTSAIAINDNGTMVGIGTHNGNAKAWLLDPRE